MYAWVQYMNHKEITSDTNYDVSVRVNDELRVVQTGKNTGNK